MSRYIDLDGFTWDGTPIKTKVMEMETNHGYLQAIGVGWLWGDNVPHIDLEEHDAKVRQDAIDEFAEKLCAYVYDKDFMSDDVIRIIAEQLKEMESD